MKKVTLIFALFWSIIIFSQCNISGDASINVLDTATYTIENDNAQCLDCHLWATIGGNSKIEGEYRKNTVKIKPIYGGRTVLSLTMLTPQGVSQCSKNIDIIDGNGVAAPQQTSSNCDIVVNAFKEVKYSEGVISLFPNETQNEYKYSWTAVYMNGEQRMSNEKVPQFNYTKDNSISTIKVKITSNKCIKDLSKTYNPSFWKMF